MSKTAIIFLSTSEENLEKTFSYTSHYHPKDYLYEREQEKYQEFQVCKEQKFPYYHLFRGGEKENNTAHPIANQIQKYTYYLQTPQRKNITAIPQEYVLLRTHCAEIYEPFAYLESLSLKNILNWEDEIKTLAWYNYVLPEFSKRKIAEITQAQLSTALLQQFTDDRGLIFLKTKWKERSCLTDVAMTHYNARYIKEDMPGEAELIISQALQLEKDSKGVVEYRVWVAQHCVSSISHYLDKELQQNIPREICQISQDFVEAHKEILPSCYVVDFGIDRQKGPVVIEINGLVASGRYGGNCFKKFLLDLTRH